MEFLIYIFCSVFIFGFASAATPILNYNEYITRCKTKSPEFNECLKVYLQEAIKISTQGSKVLSVPILEPYFIPQIEMQGSGGILIKLRNASYHGFTTSTVKKVRASPEEHNFEIHLFAPKIMITGDYALSGKLFQIPINGKGKANITMIELQTVINIKGDTDENSSKNGHQFFKVNSVNMKMKMKRMKFRFSTLFKDNAQLGDIVNQMLNNNWEEVILKMKPELEAEMSKHVHEVVKKYFDRVPYNAVFPDL